MAEEKAVQRRPRAPMDRLKAVLESMDDETLYGAQFFVQGFVAAQRLAKRTNGDAEQAMLELGNASVGEEA